MCAERDSKTVRLSIVTLHTLEEFLDTAPEIAKREGMVGALYWVKDNCPRWAIAWAWGWSSHRRS